MLSSNLLKPLMVGPICATSGQGEAFRHSCKAVPQSIVVDAEFSSIIDLTTYPLRLLVGFIRTKKVVYFTSSRSTKGFYARDLWIFLFALLLQRKLINHLHGIDFGSFRKESNFITQYLVDFFYHQVKVSIAPAEFVLNQYFLYPKMQLKTVENFFDSNMPIVFHYKKSIKTLEIIYLSNLISTKGFIVAVDACRFLYNSGVELHLTLCGHPLGDEFMSITEVNEYIESLSCEEFVDYIGPVYNELKSKLLKESHVLILPTSKDLSPICIIEGLAHGCYIISTKIGAIPFLLEGFHSSIVESTVDSISTSIFEYNNINSKMKDKFSNANQVLAFKRYTSIRYQKEVLDIIKGVYHA
jgi:glycosyltransferase involved in cell wall biosynthesis